MSKLIPDLPKTPLPGPRSLLGTRGAVLRFFADPVVAMLEAQARFGDVVGFTRDDPAWLFAFGERHNKQVLSDPARFHNYADHPIPVPETSAATYFLENLTAQNGEVHKLKRRLMMPAFSKARLRGYVSTMVETAARVVAAWPERERLDLRQQMIDLTLTNSMACLFGLHGDATAHRLADLNLRYLELIMSPLALVFPFDLPGTPYRSYLRTTQELADELRALIDRRRERGLGDDVFSALLAADEDGQRFADNELIGQAGLLVAAGHDTTAMTLTWTLLLLAAHPQIQLELADEIDAALGGAPPTADDLDALPLLDAVISESMRLLPVTPSLFFRRSTDGFELDGHQLPAGATIVLSPLLTHRDPELYPDPLRFSPRRWDDLRPSTYAYLPFGAGPRRCVGAGFASLAVRTTLVMLLQRVRVSVPSGTRVDTTLKGIIMGPKRPLELNVSPAGESVPAPQPIAGTVRELVAF